MSEEKPLRLFVAASAPAQQLTWLQQQVLPLHERWPRARWIPLENQHVTLKFLGSTPAPLLGAVREACRSVAATARPTDLRFDGLGVFPGPRKARVLWAGLEDPAGMLVKVAEGLDEALSDLGFEPEKRRFTPHLTLARFRVPVPAGDLPDLADDPGAFRLGSMGLWRSHLSPRGARYEQLREFAFGHAE